MNLSEQKKQILHLMGIPIWQLKNDPKKNRGPDNFETLKEEVAKCTLCELCHSRTQTVFGVGNPKTKILFIGEAPGANEDLKGEPFVGRAGQLLDNMLAAIGLNRKTIYIANILKCRPPNNRDPLPSEVEKCTPFLLRQIEFIKPKLIVALGRIAAHYLLNTKTSLTQLRGKIHQFNQANTPLIVTFHPAYLLRNPIDKAKAYDDLLFISNYLEDLT